MTETIISIKKITANIKRYWWLCLLATAAAAGLVAFTTWRTYTANKTAEAKDSYIGSATLYLSSENERDNAAYGAILQSPDTIAQIDALLDGAGQAPYSSETDKISIQSMSDSTAYGITVLSIGEERTRLIGQAVIDIVLEQASDVMQVETGQLASLTVSPCLWYPDGTFTIVDTPQQRVVTLSASDFLSWRKLVVVCAGFFVGAACIFAAILFDDKIRDEEEVRAVCGDLPVLGPVRLAGGKADELPEAVVREYLTKESIEKGVLLFAGGAKAAAETETRLEKWTGGRVRGAQDLYGPDFSPDKLKEYDGTFLAMRMNKNTMKELRKAQEMLKLLHVRVLALLLIR